MYVGRIVAAGITRLGDPAALYRISSRSFADRTIVVADARAEVTARRVSEIADSPFIYYGCYRVVGEHAVVGNGTHADLIADKIAWGAGPRDALADTLRFMDYEHDALSTPRIAAIVRPEQAEVFFGAVSRTDLVVWRLPLVPGQVYCIATYESMHRPEGVRSGPLSGTEPTELAREVYEGGLFAQFEKPVCGFAASFRNGAWLRGAAHAGGPT
jgi:IMP cyclohydrolase